MSPKEKTKILEFLSNFQIFIIKCGILFYWTRVFLKERKYVLIKIQMNFPFSLCKIIFLIFSIQMRNFFCIEIGKLFNAVKSGKLWIWQFGMIFYSNLVLLWSGWFSKFRMKIEPCNEQHYLSGFFLNLLGRILLG